MFSHFCVKGPSQHTLLLLLAEYRKPVKWDYKLTVKFENILIAKHQNMKMSNVNVRSQYDNIIFPSHIQVIHKHQNCYFSGIQVSIWSYVTTRNLPHKVRTQYLHFRFHANYFLWPWKIPDEISRRSMLSYN